MTTIEKLSAAVLVAAGSRPDLTADRLLDVRPGPGTTYDGDRKYASLQFVYDGRWRHDYDRDEIDSAFDAAKTHLRDGGTVRMGNRARLRSHWSKRTIRGFERQLVTAAGEAGTGLLTWTDDPPNPDDETIYDVLVRD